MGESPGEGWWRVLGPLLGYHPGAAACFRKNAKKGKAGQQCCYSADGKLITHGPGSGTPDKNDPSHIAADVTPFEDAVPTVLIFWSVVYLIIV